MYVEKTMFIRKIRAFNVDEIDGRKNLTTPGLRNTLLNCKRPLAGKLTFSRPRNIGEGQGNRATILRAKISIGISYSCML